MGINSILEGYMNNLLGLNKEVSKARMDVCKKCPLYRPVFNSVICAPIWLNPKTNEISVTEKEGYFKGCGCVLSMKTKVLDQSCPAGKW